MNFPEFFDRLKHRPSSPHVAVRLRSEGHAEVAEDGSPVGPAGFPSGYFEIRLNEMCLTDERRLHQEILPATLLVTDFKYASGDVRQPFFVSNSLLSDLPAGIAADKLRVQLRDTRVLGPTPYIGGDVNLFVGLFQTVIEDRRKALFDVFEKLFGDFDLGGVSQYVKLADKVSSTIFGCLGAPDIDCVLAERRPIATRALPPDHHVAFLRSRSGGAVDTAGLCVRDGQLRRARAGGYQVIDDADYCLVQVSCCATRNDHLTLAFAQTYRAAGVRLTEGDARGAQALMLRCRGEIFASPDLTEDHKIALMELYQSQLCALEARQAKLGRLDEESGLRDGVSSGIRVMQSRAVQAAGAMANEVERRYDDIARLSQRAEAEERPGVAELTDVQVAEHMKAVWARPERERSAATLYKALTDGVLA